MHELSGPKKPRPRTDASIGSNNSRSTAACRDLLKSYKLSFLYEPPVPLAKHTITLLFIRASLHSSTKNNLCYFIDIPDFHEAELIVTERPACSIILIQSILLFQDILLVCILLFLYFTILISPWFYSARRNGVTGLATLRPVRASARCRNF